MISLLGIPYDDSSSFLKGPKLAPSLIREALVSPSSNSSIETGLAFDQPGFIQDLGDLELSLGEGHRGEITAAIENILNLGRKSLVLGGDHSIAYPIIRAYAAQMDPLHVVQFDAHTDLYHELGGERFSHASPFARLLEDFPHVKLTQVGIRTMSRHCRAQAERFGVQVVEMKDVHSHSPLVFDGPVYVSVDIDVLDPAFAPGISHYEPGGMSVRELLSFIHRIPNRIVGADVVEFNPVRDRDGQTAMVAAKLVKELAGQMFKNER